MGADASLVNMAYRAAAAKSPGDWSDSFSKSYEGLVAYHKALTETIGKGVTAVSNVGKAISERRKEDLDEMDTTLNIDDIYKVGQEIDNLSRTTSNKKNKESNKKYENNSPSNKGEQTAANDAMLAFKNGTEENGFKGLEYYARKKFLTKKDKEKQAELQRQAQQFKDKLVQDKILKRTNAGYYGANDVNLKRTYGGDGETAMVLSQILDPDADWEQLGIQSTWEGGEKYYYYTPNRLKAEYDASSSPLITAPTKTKDVITPIESYKNDPNSVTRISAKELYSGIVLKDKQTESANKNIIIGMKQQWETHKSFSGDDGKAVGAFSLEQITKHGFKENFMNAEGGSREAVIDFWDRGLYGTNPSEDLKKGITISTYEGLLGKTFKVGDKDVDISTLDTDGDGEISDTEATAGDIKQADIDQIHRILTNPKDDAEAEFAIEEASNYLTALAKQEFDRHAPTPTGIVYGSPEWKRIQDDKLAREKFLADQNKTETRNVEFDLITKDTEGNTVSTKKNVTNTELINIDSQLGDLMKQDSFATENYVDVFGNRIGYFPGKGFAPVRLATQQDVDSGRFRAALKVSEIIRITPGSDPKNLLAYWKTPKDVFKHYSIPTTYNKKARPQ